MNEEVHFFFDAVCDLGTDGGGVVVFGEGSGPVGGYAEEEG